MRAYLSICVFPGRISEGFLFVLRVSMCLHTSIHVFPAEFAVQNVVTSPIFVRLLCKYTFHELVA